MSYRSRVYRNRNAHVHDRPDREAFFSKQTTSGDLVHQQSFFQSQLAINRSEDSYEQEADEPARKVVDRGSGAILQTEMIGQVQRATGGLEERELEAHRQAEAKEEEDKKKAARAQARKEDRKLGA